MDSVWVTDSTPFESSLLMGGKERASEGWGRSPGAVWCKGKDVLGRGGTVQRAETLHSELTRRMTSQVWSGYDGLESEVGSGLGSMGQGSCVVVRVSMSWHGAEAQYWHGSGGRIASGYDPGMGPG
jgi:hypothetical protein